MELRTVEFGAALSETEGGERNLLLGNGFSIGAHSDFGYPALYRTAVLREPTLRRFFPDPGNPNFEDAIARAATPSEAQQIRRALIRAVASVHPHALQLADRRRSCRNFLEHFAGARPGKEGRVFTTNYDLLIHWVVSSQSVNPKHTKQIKQLKLRDGFGQDQKFGPAPAELFYLHGAVHIFESRHQPGRAPDTFMLRYEVGSRLIEQVDDLMSVERYPVCVVEAKAEDKRFVQRVHPYLRIADKRFSEVCANPNGALFAFGHRFGPTDDHIAQRIAEGELRTIYIGVFNDEDRATAARLAVQWSAERGKRRPIEVVTYNTSGNPSWGPHTGDL